MANDTPYLHLPLDEIRYVDGTAHAPNVGGSGRDAIVHGNPQILHDPNMGTCLRFDGDGDYIELTDLSALTFAQGMTVMAWVRFEDISNFNTIFVLNVERNQNSKIIWAANEARSQRLAFGVNGAWWRVENGVALGQWRHFAFVYDPAGKLSILSDGAAVFSKEAAFDIANAPWKIGYIGKSSYDGDRSLFRGAMAHFRVYNQALSPADVRDLMISDKGAMAYYRETTLLKVELYTVRDDDQKPILYIEAANQGEPLEVSLTNPGDKPVAFKPFDAPTADDFHVQLRFRRNVIAPNVLRALQAPNGVAIAGWRHTAGTTPDGREDFISFVKTEAPFALNKGEAWRIQIPNFSAAAQGGARNTRVQVRYRTEPQDPGSVVRHMEVQSHLGLKTIPLIARFRDSNTLLNNGLTSNELAIEVVYTSDTGSVRLDEASKFELIVDDELTLGGSLEAASKVAWLEAEPAAAGVGHKTFAFKVKRPADGQTGVAGAPLMEVSRSQPLTFALSNWVTGKPSGTYNILLRYENIPGYWDGAWVLPVQFSPLLLRSDKIGIGTDDPGADLEIRRDAKGALGPVLRLNNFGGGAGAGGAIEFNSYNVGKGSVTAVWHDPAFRIQSVDDGNYRDALAFSSKKEANGASELQERVRITAEGRVGIGTATPAAALDVIGDAQIGGSVKATGRIKDATGFVMPVGAIVAYGGRKLPEGWLLCDGTEIKRTVYPDLYDVLMNPEKPWDPVKVPDLLSRFIVGANPQNAKYSLNQTGGSEAHTLTEQEMPAHGHKVNPEGYHQFAQVNIHYDGDPSWGAEDKTVFVPGDEKSQRHPDFIRPTGGAKANDDVWMGATQPHNNLPPYYALTYIIKY